MRNADFEDRVKASVKASIDVKQRIIGDAELMSTIIRVAELVIDTYGQGNKVLLFGNGGSAADAQHIAAELVGRFAFERPSLAALALSVNTSCITAIGNDYGFDQVFSRQIESLGSDGDTVIGISTSGNSPNVLRAMVAATKKGLRTVALTGCTGGELKQIVDYCICVPSRETPRIQECHILIGHIISELVEEAIFHASSCISGS